MKRFEFLPLAAATFAAVGLGGCYSQFNHTPRIAGIIDLHDLDEGAARITPDTGPSVESIDRHTWSRQTFLVPQDMVVTAPAYSPMRRWTVASARQVGDMPGTIDAATIDPVDNQVAEAILMPLAAIYDFVAILPRAIITWPTTPTLNPRDSYQRSTPRWQDRLPITGTAAAPEAASEADRVRREQFGDSLLLDEGERRPRELMREPVNGQRT